MENLSTRATRNLEALGDVPARLAALDDMRGKALAALYLELYGEPTRSRNAAYLRKRLAWRIQELAEGGLSQGAIDRIAAIGDGLPERWRMRQVGLTKLEPPPPVAQAPVATSRDPRLPPVGSVLQRVFEGVTYEVTVMADVFEFEGKTYKSLSAVAKEITGTAWNGFLFFGLKKPATGAAEAA